MPSPEQRARDMLALVEQSIIERRWETDTDHADEQWWLGYRAALIDLLWTDGG